MPVRDHSIEAYRKLQADGKELAQAHKIALYVDQHPGCIRPEIAEALGMDEARISARMKGLIDKRIVEESELTRKNPHTGVSCKMLKIRKPVEYREPEQVDAFRGVAA